MTSHHDSPIPLHQAASNSADRTSGRHRTDYLSLIFGLLFLAVAGWWAASYFLDWAISVHIPDAGWVLAAGLILLGLIGIVASLRRDRRDGEPAASAGDATAVMDRPEAGDPGGHRPE
jgi:TRAP-type C4-dicarboxylate transport system permease small subunit